MTKAEQTVDQALSFSPLVIALLCALLQTPTECCMHEIRCNWLAYADRKVHDVVWRKQWKGLEGTQYQPITHLKAVQQLEIDIATLAPHL